MRKREIEVGETYHLKPDGLVKIVHKYNTPDRGYLGVVTALPGYRETPISFKSDGTTIYSTMLYVDWDYRETEFTTFGGYTPVLQSFNLSRVTGGLKADSIEELRTQFIDSEDEIENYPYLSEWDRETKVLIRVFENPYYEEQ